jgi:hypothetical protein
MRLDEESFLREAELAAGPCPVQYARIPPVNLAIRAGRGAIETGTRQEQMRHEQEVIRWKHRKLSMRAVSKCPMPIVKAKKEIDATPPGDVLR